MHELSVDPADGGDRRPAQPCSTPWSTSLNTALEALREITRGVFPAQLARSGLPTAARSLFTRTGYPPLVVDDSPDGRRFEPRVEAAAYFCVAEAIRDLDDPVNVVLSLSTTTLRVAVTGREDGPLPLSHIRDRVEAAGGTVSTHQDGRPRWRRGSLPGPRRFAPSCPRPHAGGPARTPTW